MDSKWGTTVTSDLKRMIYDDIEELRTVMERSLTSEHLNDMMAFQEAAVEFIVSVLDISKIDTPDKMQQTARRAAIDYRTILSVIISPHSLYY